MKYIFPIWYAGLGNKHFARGRIQDLRSQPSLHTRTTTVLLLLLVLYCGNGGMGPAPLLG